MTGHDERGADREATGDDERPGAHAVPPAQRDATSFGAEWVDPDDAAEEMADETEGRS